MPFRPPGEYALLWIEQRRRRLEYATAMWSAGGLDDSSGLRLTRSGLAGLAGDLRALRQEVVAEAVDKAVAALGCHPTCKSTDILFVDRRVLIFDDNEVTSDLIAIALDSLGCHTTTALTLADWDWLLTEFDPQAIVIEPAHAELIDTSVHDLLKRHVKPMTPVILFTEAHEDETTGEMEAVGLVTKDQGIDGLTKQLEELFLQIIW